MSNSPSFCLYSRAPHNGENFLSICSPDKIGLGWCPDIGCTTHVAQGSTALVAENGLVYSMGWNSKVPEGPCLRLCGCLVLFCRRHCCVVTVVPVAHPLRHHHLVDVFRPVSRNMKEIRLVSFAQCRFIVLGFWSMRRAHCYCAT